MVLKPTYGNFIVLDFLNSVGEYTLFTMNEPWEILRPLVTNLPKLIIYNVDMDLFHLNDLYEKIKEKLGTDTSIIGIGGGTSTDTAKFMAWKYEQEKKEKLDLILIPSIISVDAFLCSSIAIRDENKVRYVGNAVPSSILIDYDLIQKAPQELNRAGVSDTISITSALGDWRLEHVEINGEFDRKVFNKAKRIAGDLLKESDEISIVSNKGIRVMVECFYREVMLCEEWGNSRPEEGSEHFLAYCLENITGLHYIHGNLIGMSVLISLYLQEEYAEFSFEKLQNFFQDIKIRISPQDQ